MAKFAQGQQINVKKVLPLLSTKTLFKYNNDNL